LEQIFAVCSNVDISCLNFHNIKIKKFVTNKLISEYSFYKFKLTIYGNSSDDKNVFQKLSRFLHIGCSVPVDGRIMTVEKSNLNLKARYGGELVGEICYFFIPMPRFSHFYDL